ncbi:hypothetical protein LENED_001268 [Lentinula edodes]|uniref:Uncharacterized protein n=1 Tax=Lentinula edodes TaxID=5353 RepID=A0A1Q3DXY5_LENED|nr:hypothetical protein LENED_001268 [Lentinula edodes]
MRMRTMISRCGQRRIPGAYKGQCKGKGSPPSEGHECVYRTTVFFSPLCILRRTSLILNGSQAHQQRAS